MVSNFTFNTCRTIINELGAINRIGSICQQQRITRPLIVTDQGIVQLGMLERVEQLLDQSGLDVVVFADVVADPPEEVINRALVLAQDQKVDGVIGLGGGSSMDTAKLVALMARSGESLEQIYGVDNAKGQRLPLILVPTTAGTGSEVTAVAIVTTGESTKMGVVAPQLYPDVALLDAELTVGLPAHITAMTGVDAMVHAIEAYTSVHKKNPYSDMLAREALRIMSQNIETACKHGDNLQARQEMLFGACLAGQAFANSPVAAVHALAYPLGGHYHLPHGLTNSLVLPQVLRFNADLAEQLYAELAVVVIPADELQASATQRCQQFIAYFDQLVLELGLPTRLAELDVPESDLPMLAKDAMEQQRLLVNNPRAVTERDALEIYQAIY